MTRKIQVHHVDAFTREPFTGNPTGVVLNADALTETQMLAVARELNNAETAFILSPDGADHTVRARFFTPRSEAGFVGHATVAAQYVLSRRHDAPRRQQQKSKAGIVDIEVRGTDADRRIAIRRNPPPVGRELSHRERLAALDALALASQRLDSPIPPGAPDHLPESRMFCPALGIAEDPVSGNAHGLLGAYLAQLRLITRSGERAHFNGIQD